MRIMLHQKPGLLAALLTLALLCQPTAAADWLTPENEKNAALAMLSRLQSTGLELEGDPADQLAGAVLAIRSMAGRIDTWGIDQILAQTPRFSEPALPDLGDPTVQAIAAYGTCSLTLYPELAETSEEKYFVAAGEFAVLLLSGFLRQHYLREGGSDEQLAELLTGGPMVKYSQAVQADQDRVNRALKECQPFYRRVVGQAE